jgi:hypothetical protein
MDCLPDSLRACAGDLFGKTVQTSRQLNYLKSRAYALTGTLLRHSRTVSVYAAELAGKLADSFERNSGPDWKWFEDSITYCNGIIPLSLLLAGKSILSGAGTERCLTAGIRSLDFLSETVFSGGIFRPVGCNGWYRRGGKPARFDEQPVEACSMMLACREAYRFTGEQLWQTRTDLCHDWYLGRNSLGKPMLDPDTGGCFDGIGKNGRNENQGAESIVSWLIAELVYPDTERTGTDIVC